MSLSPFNRIVTCLALIIGPLSLIVTSIVQWTLQPTGAAPTAADVAAQFPAAWTVIGLLSVFGPLCWLAGIPATVTLAPAKGAIVTSIGALITGLGLATAIGHLALYFALSGTVADSPLGDADPLSNALLIVFLIAFAAGPIVLSIGLRMARIVPVWAPIAAIVTAAAGFLGGPIAGAVQLVTLAATWAPIVVAVLRQPRSADRPSSERARPATVTR